MTYSNEIDWVTWPPSEYPCYHVNEWTCVCGTEHTSYFFSSELGDNDSDSFDFTCSCGQYFKKFWRVSARAGCSLKRSGWCKVGPLTGGVTVEVIK